VGESQGQPLALDDGSRIGVVGGGPAGSFFSYFLLEMSRRVGLDVAVDIYEPRDFSA
jgi:flavin-dependent dehydrogenase